MIVHLFHSKFIRNWDSDWIYLGRDYIQMKKWENSCKGKRISLSDEIEKAKVELLTDYLTWIEKQRIANSDSLSWWMSFLAGRNNLVCFFYLNICQIWGLNGWLDIQKQKNNCKLMIVCEDIFILSALRANLNKWKLKYFTVSNLLGFFHDGAYWTLKIIIQFLNEVVRIVKHKYAARKTFKKSSSLTKSSVAYLVFQCLDSKPFSNNSSKIMDRYLMSLPAWLEEKGLNVVRLPWLIRTDLPLIRIYERLRKDSALIVWDFVTIFDIFKAFARHILSFFFIKSFIKFKAININALCFKERLLQLSSFANIEFLLHVPLINKWSKGYDKIIAINTFERNQLEMGIASALRKTKNKSYCIGYYHSLTTKDYFSYHSLSSEWDSHIVPDIIITNGLLSKEILIKQGAPLNRIKEGPALRQNKNAILQKDYKKCKDVLLLLSIDLIATYELLNAFYTIHIWIRDNLKVNVRLKPHPMVSESDILRIMGIEKLPDNWIWEKGEIYEALQNAYCVSAITTASVYDAVLSGCIVIPIQKELDFMGNYLDILEDKYEYLKSVKVEFLKDRLLEIYVTNQELLLEEFTKVREQLSYGLGDVSEENMNMFIID